MSSQSNPKNGKNLPSKAMVGLRAIIAEEKASRSSTSSSIDRPASSTAIKKINKGVHERAKKDEIIEQPIKERKKVMIGGVWYYEGEDEDKESLIDFERKAWEEYERSELAKARVDTQKRFDYIKTNSEYDLELDDTRREEKRRLVAELAEETLKGRQEQQSLQAKREHDKISRLELIKSKASAIKSNMSKNQTATRSASSTSNPSTQDLQATTTPAMPPHQNSQVDVTETLRNILVESDDDEEQPTQSSKRKGTLQFKKPKLSENLDDKTS